MRRRSPSPIPPSMYRHFAAITLALTMGLAMFANGENHQARATQSDQVEVAAQEEPARIVRAPKSATSAASSQWYSEALDGAFAGRVIKHARHGARTCVRRRIQRVDCRAAAGEQHGRQAKTCRYKTGRHKPLHWHILTQGRASFRRPRQDPCSTR